MCDYLLLDRRLIQMGDKFIILVGDGMGDYPLDSLGGLTPLEAARTPNLDRLVSNRDPWDCADDPSGDAAWERRG